uniref:ATP synthase subunit a n=1 Tax=Austrolebias charrua TaxID=308057 RepID=A0A0R7A0R5_9TELE|nr:ATP synthase F0 subunit 6 [Austrolebias charrua]AKL82657.1 ATP synthase subunit 6 [Austrolebias charrua]
MTMNLFNQFLSPLFLGVPLLAIALITPWIFFPEPSTRWLNNRLLLTQNWLMSVFMLQTFQPMNIKGHTWAFLLTALFMLLISLNLLGLLPYTFTPTTQLSLNMAFALPLWLATVITGFRNSSTHVLAHLLPEGTPTLLIPILVIIETISLFIRPLALGVRLTANLTAGHLLIQLVSMATFFLTSFFLPAAFLTLTLLFFLTILEIAVAVIQAYVFILLLSLYLQENI